MDGGNTMKKVMLILIAVMFMASTAWAGNIPEFDAVGCDVTNVFAQTNQAQYGQVIRNNVRAEWSNQFLQCHFSGSCSL